MYSRISIYKTTKKYKNMSVERTIDIYTQDGKWINSYASKNLNIEELAHEEDIEQLCQENNYYAIGVSELPFENENFGNVPYEKLIDDIFSAKEYQDKIEITTQENVYGDMYENTYTYTKESGLLSTEDGGCILAKNLGIEQLKIKFANVFNGSRFLFI